MKTYNNVYLIDGIRIPACYMIDDSVDQSAYYAALPHNATNWVAREERWNHHVRRTPVGMRADEASHKWVPRVDARPDGFTVRWLQLEPRA